MNNDEDVEELENVDDSTEDELGKALDEERTRDKSKIEQEARKKVNEKAKKGLRKLKGSLFKSVTAVPFASVIIVIFMSIGIISYIVTMPGFVQQKMYDLVNGLKVDLTKWWSGSNAFLNDPNSEDFNTPKLELLQYLDEMGLNPIGMGFVAYAARDENNKIYNYISDFMTEGEMTRLTGSYSNGDLLYKYIVASERTYMMNDDGLKGILGLANKTDFKGMLSFTKDIGSTLNGKLAVDRSTKSLTITETSLFKVKEQKFTFDLDSWVGRYGKPIEFLLALHIATMSPDITEEFIDNPNLQTDVNIKVEREKYDADYTVKYKDENGDMQDSPVKLGRTGADGDQDKLYNVMMKHLKINDEHEDGSITFEYENTDDISAEDITISGLYELITQMNPENDKSSNVQAENQNLKNALNDCMKQFLGDDWFIAKNTIGTFQAYENSTRELPFLCELQYRKDGWLENAYEPNQASGILSGVPDYIKWDKVKVNENGQEIEKEGRYGYLSFTGAYGQTTNLKFDRERQCAESSDGTRTNSMAGIQRYINHPQLYFTENFHPNEGERNAGAGSGPMDIFTANNESILAMLIAFDQYIYHYNGQFLASENWEEYNPAYLSGKYASRINRMTFRWTGNDKLYLNLSKHWMDFIDRSNIKEDDLTQELEYLTKKISSYMDMINNKNKYIQQFVDDILAQEVGNYSSGKLKLENIIKIYETLKDAPSKVNFEEPRILYVVKHWFKDLDFRASYEKQASEKHIQLDDLGTDELEVVMDLSGKAYKQTKQPYVIKGNNVTLDGEKKTKEYNDITTSNGGKETPNGKGELQILEDAGSGYKAAKKILTQGRYYVYDGTEASSKGIYYNKILEQIQPGQCADVKVLDGRIYAIHPVDESVMIGAINSVGTDKVQSIENNTVEIVLYNEIPQKRKQKTNNPDEVVEVELSSKVKCYYIKVNNSIAYKSPAQNPYDESKESARIINEVLDAMEIINKRQIVSFDTIVTTYKDTETGEEKEQIYSGDTAMLTAFNVLENMHTESAEHIYRDLKEFLIDLGYYTSAEFEAINTNVLRWFIPAYMPEDSGHWKQNKDSDSIKYGAVIYPVEIDNNTGDIKENGFEPDSAVIAPGDCRIISVDSNKITIEFDGISQPSIGLLNGYTMIISGVKPEDTILTLKGEISVADAINNKTVIKCGEKIATTTDEKIIVVLMDNKGAYISTVDNYMTPPTLEDILMFDKDLEEIAEYIWQWEGVSDADKNDGDYYTLEHPEGDVPTIGHGVTSATVNTWIELGYGQYIENGRIVSGVPIPKDVVDNVSKQEIKKHLDILENLLAENGVVWGGNQKLAWVSLHYNGFAPTPEEIVVDWSKGNRMLVRQKWLNCVNWNTRFQRGHQNRRAQEWIIFNTGEEIPPSEAYNKCYITNEY